MSIAPVATFLGSDYEQVVEDVVQVVEVLIIADIVRTIIVEPTLESVGVLGIIVVIRIMLSFSLEVEIDGSWPWTHWKTEGSGKKP